MASSSENSSTNRSASVLELTGAGGYDKFRLKKVPIGKIDENSILLRVKFAGLNFADLMRRQGIYSPAPKFPYVPGFEASGIVEEIGSKVSNLKVSDRIVAFSGEGMWADFVSVPADRCFKIPDKMSFEEAAAFIVNYLTAFHILFEFGNLRPNKSVLIHMAAGGVGIAAIQLCRTVENVTIFGTASASKHQTLKELGCQHPIDYRTQDYAAEIRKISPTGVDIIMDPLNGEDSVRGYELLKPLGRIIHFGAANVAASGENRSLMTMFKTWYKCLSVNSISILSQNKSVAGYHLGYLLRDLENNKSFAESALKELFQLYESGHLKPQIDTIFPYSKIAEAMQRMHNRLNVGKVLLRPDDAEQNSKNSKTEQN